MKNESAEQFAERIKKIREEAQAAIEAAHATMKRYYDRKRSNSQEFKIGDFVWLEGTNIKTDRPTKKLEDKRYGPFKILEKVGKLAYQLQLPSCWKALYPVQNEVSLSPYTPPSYPSQKKDPPPPPPDLIQGEKKYEIEKLVDSRLQNSDLQYQVKWKGYPHHEWTWEPRTELMKHAKKVIAEFHKKHPNAPRLKLKNMRFQKCVRSTKPDNIPAYLYNWEDSVFERTLRRS